MIALIAHGAVACALGFAGLGLGAAPANADPGWDPGPGGGHDGPDRWWGGGGKRQAQRLLAHPRSQLVGTTVGGAAVGWSYPPPVQWRGPLRPPLLGLWIPLVGIG